MNKKQFLEKVKESLNGIIEKENDIDDKESFDLEITPYDLIEFKDREEEKKYINYKTANYDISENLLSEDGNDGVIVISSSCKYVASPIFIHSDAFVKLLNYVRQEKRKFYNSDVIDFYTSKGYILIRVVNNNGIVGFDLYIPEKINDYQIRALERICRELGYVRKELEDFDDKNANNIKYSIKTLRDSVEQNELIKRL